MLLISIISCNKEEGFNYPLVYTGEVTDISNKGAVFNAKIIDLGKDDIIEYGFVWDSQINPTVEKSEKLVIREAPKTGAISEYISTTLRSGVIYFARAFVRSSNYTTYGKEVSFTSLGSLAPQIDGFTPKTGNIGDTITITGHNFSYRISENQVKFGRFEANILKANQDSLIVIVPDSLDTLSSYISISIIQNNTVSVEKFNLIPLVFTDFYEKTGTFNSQVTLIGNNFLANPASLHVYFGYFEAKILEIQDRKIIVSIPDKLNENSYLIKVIMNNLTVSSRELFNFQIPLITDFYPKIATFGSVVTINGNYFASNPIKLHVFFDEFEAEIIELHDGNIMAKVPDKLDKRQCKLKVIMNECTIVSVEKFQLAPLSINDFTPKVAVTGNTITLTGNNFSPVPKNNIITIGGLKAEVTKVSVNEIEVRLPIQDGKYYSFRDAIISVEVIGEILNYNTTLLVNDKWFRHKDAPIDFTGSFYSVVNKKAYIGLNGNIGFWEYNPINDEYLKLADFSGYQRNGGNGFAINNKIYYGSGFDNNNNLKDFWEYDISSNSWIQKTNFPGKARTGSITFSINGFGYLGGGKEDSEFFSSKNPFDDFWKYNYVNDAWSRIPSFLDIDTNSVFGMANGISVVVGDIAYIGLGWNMVYSPDGQQERWFSYNSLTNTWNRHSNFPEPRAYHQAIAFNLTGVPYVKTISSNFYSYNSSSDSWQMISTGLLPNDISGIGFSIGSIAYIGIGKELWEYDPSR